MIVKTALFDLELTTPLPFLGTSRMFMMHCDRLQVQRSNQTLTIIKKKGGMHGISIIREMYQRIRPYSS